MTDRRHQLGVTGIGWLVILGLIGFFSLLALKLFPVYMEKMKMDSAATYVANQPGMATKREKEVINVLVKNMDVQGVERFDERNYKSYARVKKLKGRKTKSLILKYDIRQPLFGDLDIVLKYEKVVDLSK